MCLWNPGAKAIGILEPESDPDADDGARRINIQSHGPGYKGHQRQINGLLAPRASVCPDKPRAALAQATKSFEDDWSRRMSDRLRLEAPRTWIDETRSKAEIVRALRQEHTHLDKRIRGLYEQLLSPNQWRSSADLAQVAVVQPSVEDRQPVRYKLDLAVWFSCTENPLVFSSLCRHSLLGPGDEDDSDGQIPEPCLFAEACNSWNEADWEGTCELFGRDASATKANVGAFLRP
ncbi:hypothetical protein PG994_015270 [Apiospora phragmitis]|uniref:DUF7607 domain-containing protein n=1 Tax=Apiospora phragmitis TaxID=2905665 RepID=A0ABR1SR18_9PEZI